jgi:hypothetical protein
MIGAVPAAIIFGYVGMVIFGLPLYVAVRVVKKWPVVAVTLAAVIGVFAALVVPQLLELVRPIALENLRLIAQNPSDWLNAPSLSGGAVGVTFWYLTTQKWPSNTKVGRK